MSSYLLNHIITPQGVTKNKIRSISHMSKFIFVTSQVDSEKRTAMMKTLNYLHIINAVLIYEKNSEIFSIVPNLFTKSQKLLKDLDTKNLTSILFPDKFQNLHDFKFKIVYTSHSDSIYLSGKYLQCPLCNFPYILKNRLKIDIEFVELGANVTNSSRIILQVLGEGRNLTNNFTIYMHIIGIYTLPLYLVPKLRTYQQNEQCFVVTVPKSIPIYEQILILPLESRLWVFLLITIACCMIIWKFYNKFGLTDSHWHFLFVIYGYFLGQSLNLRM